MLYNYLYHKNGITPVKDSPTQRKQMLKKGDLMNPYTPDAKLFEDEWNLPQNPFPFLGADEYGDEQILGLFEIDRESTIRAFSLQNSIIEGSYGTGKTMLLKAIYSFNYSKMIVDIAEAGKTDIVPVYIKFSDLPFISDGIYRELILYTYRKMLDTRFLITRFINDSTWFDRFKLWLGRLAGTGVFSEDKRYSELQTDVVTNRVKDIFSAQGKVGFEWLKELGIKYEKSFEKEFITNKNLTITDLEDLHKRGFGKICNKVLILIDEVDRLPIEAFRKEKGQRYSIYENFLNQLRTSSSFLYKIAVYPGTDSSSQVEGSRIGNRIKLGFNIKDTNDFCAARDFFYRLLKSYLSYCSRSDIDPRLFFLINFVDDAEKYPNRVKRVDAQHYGDSLEQLVSGSNGIVRRFIKLAGDSMLEAIKRRQGKLIVSKYNVFDAMRIFGRELVERLNENDRAIVDRIAFFCMQNKTFRFRPIEKQDLFLSIHDESKQDNVIYPVLDQDRQGITYIFEFDYCYCVYRNIPTHLFLNAEQVSTERSIVNGKWIVKPVNVPQSVTNLEAKIEGTVMVFKQRGNFGFISYLPHKDLWFHKANIVKMKSDTVIKMGTKVLYRIGRNYEGECAVDIEIE
jgi:cold shock CspA family protein